MDDLLILGTGPHAVEMAEIVDRVNRCRPTFNLIGLVAAGNRREQIGSTLHGIPVVGDVSALERFRACRIVYDNEFLDPIAVPRGRLTNLIDPSAFVSRTAVLGSGCVIYPHCYIGLRAHVGDRLFMLAGGTINHDDRIGNRVTLCSGATLAGHVRILDGCYLGQGANIRQYLTIGAGATIGMGAVVLRDVPPDTTVVGNPARILK